MNEFERMAAQEEAENWIDVLPTHQDSGSQENDGMNEFERMAAAEAKRQENKFGFLDYAKDIGQQVAKKTASGAIGAYGNILDTFRLQIPEGKNLPGQEQVYNIQSKLLDKLQRGEKLSFGEHMLLSDDDIVSGMRLPTSKEVDRGIESVTGIGEGKTAPGRMAGRTAEFVGEGAATGGDLKTLTALGLSGLAGQGIREAGGPEALATGVEILGPLGSSAITKNLAPLSKTGKDIVNAGRKLGLSEAQIAPLINSERKIGLLSKAARKGERTKNAFADVKKALGDSYDAIKSSPDAKKVLSNADQLNIRREFGNIRNELSKTLAPSPDKQAALDYIEKSLDTLRNVDITPEHLVNFWQDVNRSVNWNSIRGGKKSLTSLKEPVADALKKVSPKLAEDFELTNELYSKYARTAKKLKPDIVDSFLNKGEVFAIGPSGIALATGNPWPLLSLGSEAAIRTLATEMITNPYFQTIAGKLVNNFNAGSVKAIETSVKQVQEYMQRKHPKEDWSFLIEKPD